MSLFSTVNDRKNTKSMKWDNLETIFNTEDILPMWVADMDIKAPQEVNEALINRAKHGIYGYTMIDDDVRASIVNWVNKRHQWEIDAKWLSFSLGVVTSLHIAIQTFTEPNDKVLIQTPIYTPFFNVIEDHDREIVKSPLIEKNNSFQINFKDLEEQLSQGVKAFILCSPHNPVGRVWTKEELNKIAALCLKYDVLILSDEIHSDLIYPDHKHIPIASLSEEIAAQTITFMSPSKTFNLAGLQASYIITSDSEKRAKINQWLSKNGLNSLNTMGITALETAYTHGGEWLEELLELLTSNQNYVINKFKENAKVLTVIPSEGTYLMWINCSGLNMTSAELKEFMIEKAKVGLNPGLGYGEEGAQYMRINIACPRPTLEEGINRIIKAIKDR